MQPRPLFAALQFCRFSGCCLKFCTPTVPVRLIVTPCSTKSCDVDIPLSSPSAQRHLLPYVASEFARTGELTELSRMSWSPSEITPSRLAQGADAGSWA